MPRPYLSGHKLSPLAGCVTEALVAAGTEVVFDEESAPGDESRDFPIEG